MFDYLIRFRAASVAQRRDAIIKLGQSNDVRAIALLEQIAADEPDPSLKTLAEWAVQHLRSLSSAPSARAAPPTSNSPPVIPQPPIAEPPMADLLRSATSQSTDSEKASGVAPSEPPVKPVSEEQKRRAKARLDYALSLHMSKQDAKALPVLAEAVAADPSILESPMVQNLAVALTGEARDRALEIVREKSRDPKVIGQSARPEFKLESSAELMDTVLEIFGLLVVVVLIFAVIDIGAIRLFNRAVDAVSSGLGQLNANDPNAVGTAVAEFCALGAQLASANSSQPQATLAAGSPPLATSIAQFVHNPDMATLSAQCVPPTPQDAFSQINLALQQATPTVAAPGTQATTMAHVQAALNQLTIPIPPAKTVIDDSLSFGLRFWVSLLLGLLVIYIVGSVIGGAGALLKFIRYVTRTYLGLFGAILIGLALLYLIVTRSDMASSTQVVVGGLAIVLIGASGLIGFFMLAFAVGRGHQFGFLRGLIAFLVGLFVFGVLVNVLGIGEALGR